MSQQINLLPARGGVDRQLLIGVGLLVAGALAAAGWWAVLRQDTARVQAQFDVQAQQLAALQNELQRLKSEDDEATRLQAEIASLKPQAEALKDFLAEVRNGNLGLPHGFSPHLERLARVPNPETWLTTIDLRHRGTQLTVSGMGLSGTAVANYAGELNRSFADQGIQVHSLELTRQGPVNAAPAPDAKAAPPSPVTFRLY